MIPQVYAQPFYLNTYNNLGNQMFQYAIARAYCLKHHKTLYYGTSYNKNYQLKDVFHISLPAKKRPSNIRQLYLSRFSQEIFDHPHYQAIDNPYPDWRWFEGYKQQIIKDFQFRPSKNPQNIQLAAKIKTQNAVAVHFRRGDYLTAKTHMVNLPLSYYHTAMAYLFRKNQNVHFYIFSDDIDWVEKNVQIDYPHTFVKNNQGGDSYYDMWLMSLCKHNIIANSSFSWWGAYLNKNPDKIVIAPSEWVNEDNHLFIQSIIPPGWYVFNSSYIE